MRNRRLLLASLVTILGCGTGNDSTPGADIGSDEQAVMRAFPVGSFIIPMDTASQDAATLRAFGLVYRLLQASGTKKPVFLRTNLNAGHGIGTSLSDQIDEDTHVYAFLFDVLKVK